MNPLHFAIAAAPLMVYFLMMGLINLRRTPFVTTGARDAATLGIGIAGLVMVGPMELFFPEAASRMLGYVVWILLIAFYGLCVALLVLLMRPRIVIYNSEPERIRSVLAEIASRLDKRSRWLEDGLVMPTINVRLNVEGSGLLNNTQLVSIGNRQNLEGWRELEKGLKRELKSNQMAPNAVGYAMLGVALMLAVVSTTWMVTQRQEVAQAFVEMFRI